MAPLATSLPSLNPFLRLVITPWEYRFMRPSVRNWVCTPRSFLSLSASRVAWGVAPKLICMVEPSSMSRATCWAMSRADSNSGGPPMVSRGSAASTTRSMSFRCKKLRPSTRGMAGFTWAMTRSADWAAARVTSTLMPRLTQPKSSGSLTWIRATCTGNWPLLNKRGTAERLMGVRKRLERESWRGLAEPR